MGLAFDPMQGFRQRQPFKQAEPFPRVPVPGQVKAIPADIFQASERRFEFRFVGTRGVGAVADKLVTALPRVVRSPGGNVDESERDERRSKRRISWPCATAWASDM